MQHGTMEGHIADALYFTQHGTMEGHIADALYFTHSAKEFRAFTRNRTKKGGGGTREIPIDGVPTESQTDGNTVCAGWRVRIPLDAGRLTSNRREPFQGQTDASSTHIH